MIDEVSEKPNICFNNFEKVRWLVLTGHDLPLSDISFVFPQGKSAPQTKIEHVLWTNSKLSTLFSKK